MKNPIILFSIILAILGFQPASAQELDKATVKQLIDSRDFVFIPQSVSPMSGGTRQLTPDFEFRINRDTIYSYLPYFGRAYTTMPGEGGISFTSTSFEYKTKDRKKKGWELTIRPKDVRSVRSMNFTLFENGYATLFVNSDHRQPINFYGYIRKAE